MTLIAQTEFDGKHLRKNMLLTVIGENQMWI